MHLTPAGFPSGIQGIGEEIDKAMQQAPQSGRHFIDDVVCIIGDGSEDITAQRHKG